MSEGAWTIALQSAALSDTKADLDRLARLIEEARR